MAVAAEKQQREIDAGSPSTSGAEFRQYTMLSFFKQIGLVLVGFVIAYILTLVVYIIEPEELFDHDVNRVILFPWGFAKMTLSLFYPLAPILGLFWRKFYGIVFYLSLTCAVLWTALGLNAVLFSTFGSGVALMLLVLFYATCSIIPICYCFAWRLNKKYWAEKDRRKGAI